MAGITCLTGDSLSHSPPFLYLYFHPPPWLEKKHTRSLIGNAFAACFTEESYYSNSYSILYKNLVSFENATIFKMYLIINTRILLSLAAQARIFEATLYCHRVQCHGALE